MRIRKPRRCQQLNLFASQFRHKQKYGKGNPLTKADKLHRIKTYKEIRKAGGTLRDVAIEWGMSPNSGGTCQWKVWNYEEELGLDITYVI